MTGQTEAVRRGDRAQVVLGVKVQRLYSGVTGHRLYPGVTGHRLYPGMTGQRLSSIWDLSGVLGEHDWTAAQVCIF